MTPEIQRGGKEGEQCLSFYEYVDGHLSVLSWLFIVSPYCSCFLYRLFLYSSLSWFSSSFSLCSSSVFSLLRPIFTGWYFLGLCPSAMLLLFHILPWWSYPSLGLHGNGFQIYCSSLTSCLSSRPVCLAVQCSLVLGYPTGNSNSICSKLNLPSLPVFPSVNDLLDYPEIWKISPSTQPYAQTIASFISSSMK